jgi:peptidoglycan/xylan/chitin deacetylase (PgdA/CDA1 family)
VSTTPEVAKPSALRSLIRLIKLGISILYFLWTRAGRALFGNRNGSCIVLYYHSVPGPYRERFERQMKLVANRKKAMDIAAIGATPKGSDAIVITFDDALQNFTENAVPVLVGLNIPATVFVVTDALGAKPVWGEGYYGANERIMSQEELISLPALITVGSHTLTHPDLTSLSVESAAAEIKVSREKLEAMLNRPVPLFSFPHGAYNDMLVRQCKDAGYQKVFTTDPEFASNAKDNFVIGRVTADPWDWPVEFYLKISGAYCWQPLAKGAVRSVKSLFGAN